MSPIRGEPQHTFRNEFVKLARHTVEERARRKSVQPQALLANLQR